MKEIIQQFTNKHKNSKFYISYCDFKDFDAYAETNFKHRHLFICSKRDELKIVESDHALISIFPERTDSIELEGVTYRHAPIEREDQFILMMNVETGAFVTKGHVPRSIVSEALNRISIAVDTLMFYDSQKAKGVDYLNATYTWLGFGWYRQDEFHIGGRYSNVGGFFIQYSDGMWEIDCSLDKQTIRSMKRHIPKKVSHRRNLLIERVSSKMQSKYDLFMKCLFESLESQEFKDRIHESLKDSNATEQLLIDAKTGPMKTLHRQLSSRLVYDYLADHLSARFNIKLLPGTGTISVEDASCLSHFESNVKDYSVASIGECVRLDFRSKYDYTKELSDEQIEFLESNDVESEIFKNLLNLTVFVDDLESLTDKITLLADFLKDFK